MMNKNVGLIALFASLSVHAGSMGADTFNNPWFASIGTGFSWTEKPGIVNPNPAQWDTSAQGYDSSLGNRGFYTFAVGKQTYRWVDLSVNYLDHQLFNYQMFQSGVSNTPGYTGSDRTRYFNLSNRAVLANVFLHPEETYFSLSQIGFMPFVGAGIGYARNQMNNFYTVGSTVVSGSSIGSTDSIGGLTGSNSLAWQGSVGFNIKPDLSHLSVDVGYRYFDGGNFAGPTRVDTNAMGWVSSSPWAGQLIANQAFIEFKYTV